MPHIHVISLGGLYGARGCGDSSRCGHDSSIRVSWLIHTCVITVRRDCTMPHMRVISLGGWYGARRCSDSSQRVS